MNFEDHFLNICQVLEPYSVFWRTEVIEQYPSCFDVYPEEWIDDLLRLNAEELFRFERQNDISLLRSETLRNYCATMRESARFALAARSDSCSLSNETLMHINAKKRHEIHRFLELLEQLSSRQNVDSFVDFGGGIGNLARIIARQYRIPATSIDFNPALQDTGRKRYASYCPQHAAALEFHTADILALEELPQLCGRDNSSQTLSVGLHTCGPLANAHLRLSLAAELPLILNFGCCYNKLSEDDYYLSDFGKARGIKIGPTARVLASHTPRTRRQDHDQWKQVKRYRYLIHLFLYHVLGRKEFCSLGSSPAALYQCDFLTYAAEQLKRLEIPFDSQMSKLIEEFWMDPEYHAICWKMILANSIRSFAGRPIEALFALDRGMYLSDHSYCVEIQQVFDSSISPRNLGVLAVKEKKFLPAQKTPIPTTH